MVVGVPKLHQQDNYFDFQRKLRDQKYSLKSKRGYCGREFCKVELCLLLFSGAVLRVSLTPALNPPMPSGEKPEKPSGNQLYHLHLR
ncbi:hypothetical protein HID58_022540 [Brassica napus]|uniref:BnaA06g20190D protein n=3 Tax=Brassica TaxID=3705 RepID=A0A078FD66_BRANA|nr:hypothetical protein HID58_022540 [Brassica napus]CAF2085903.1 unnamed protein product [Brassica napus]CDY12325.1 BnaA06g20190D [Brassica napus]